MKLVSDGTKIEFSIDDGTTWLDLTCQSGTWDGPSFSVAEVTGTSLCREEGTTSLPGSVDPGTFSVNGFFDPNDEAVEALYAMKATQPSPPVVMWKKTFTDEQARVESFKGYLQSFSNNGSTDAFVALAFNVRLSESSVLEAAA